MARGSPLYPRISSTGAGSAAGEMFRPSPCASLTTTASAPAANAPRAAAATSASICARNATYPEPPLRDSSVLTMPATPSMSALMNTRIGA